MQAQQDPQAFIAAGIGLTGSEGQANWQLDRNANLLAGYRILPGLLAIAYFDFNSFHYQGFHNDIHSSGNYKLSSFLVGGKATVAIPGKAISPYFLGVVGISRATPAQDSVFSIRQTGTIVSHDISGSTTTFLGAAGCDISIYKGFFVFGEIRASGGSNTHIYDILVIFRAGIGFAHY